MKAHITFCDDIREEINGKFVLVGVYSGELAIGVSKSATRAPIANIATYIELSDLAKGKHDFLATVIYNSTDGVREISSIEWEVDVDYPDSPSVITPTGLRFPVEKDGLIEVKIRKIGDDDVELLAGKLRISLKPVDDFIDHMPGIAP